MIPWQYGLSHRLNGDVRPRTSHEADLYSALSRLFSLRHVGPGTVLHTSLWTFFMFHNIIILIYRHEDRYSGHHFGKGSCLWIEGANSCLHISPRFSNVFLRIPRRRGQYVLNTWGSIYPLLLVICIVPGDHRWIALWSHNISLHKSNTISSSITSSIIGISYL